MKRLATLIMLILISLLLGCSSVHKQWGSNSVTPQMDSRLFVDVKNTGEVSGKASQSILFWCFRLSGQKKYADGVNFTARDKGLGGAFRQILALNPLSRDIAKAKSAAAYNALDGTGADYILNPRYNVEISDYWFYKEIKATVKGEGCIITNYRKAPDSFHYGGGK